MRLHDNVEMRELLIVEVLPFPVNQKLLDA